MKLKKRTFKFSKRKFVKCRDENSKYIKKTKNI